MNWRALDREECPDCGEPLRPPNDAELRQCSSGDCSFSVYEERRLEIIEEMSDEDSFAMYGPRDRIV